MSISFISGPRRPKKRQNFELGAHSLLPYFNMVFLLNIFIFNRRAEIWTMDGSSSSPLKYQSNWKSKGTNHSAIIYNTDIYNSIILLMADVNLDLIDILEMSTSKIIFYIAYIVYCKNSPCLLLLENAYLLKFDWYYCLRWTSSLERQLGTKIG